MIYYHPGVTVKTVGFAQGNDSFFSARCLSRTVGIESLPERKRSTLVSTATRIRGKLRQCINFNATVLLDIGIARIKYYCNIRIFPIFRTRVTYIYIIYIYIYIYISPRHYHRHRQRHTHHAACARVSCYHNPLGEYSKKKKTLAIYPDGYLNGPHIRMSLHFRTELCPVHSQYPLDQSFFLWGELLRVGGAAITTPHSLATPMHSQVPEHVLRSINQE